jgi:hypothetical protein
MTLYEPDPVAVALMRPIRGRDLTALECLLSGNPGLAAARIGQPGKTAHAAARGHRLARTPAGTSS